MPRPGVEADFSRLKDPFYIRLTLLAGALVFGAVTVAGALAYSRVADELRTVRQLEESRRREVAEVERAIREREERLRRLEQDPAEIERTIRMRLKYAAEGEVVFRFPEPGRAPGSP